MLKQQLQEELESIIEQPFHDNPNLDPEPPLDKPISGAGMKKFTRRDKAYWGQYKSQRKQPKSEKKTREKVKKQRAAQTHQKRITRINKALGLKEEKGFGPNLNKELLDALDGKSSYVAKTYNEYEREGSIN